MEREFYFIGEQILFEKQLKKYIFKKHNFELRNSLNQKFLIKFKNTFLSL